MENNLILREATSSAPAIYADNEKQLQDWQEVELLLKKIKDVRNRFHINLFAPGMLTDATNFEKCRVNAEEFKKRYRAADYEL